MMNVEEAKKAFYEILERYSDDPEYVHYEFDKILLECVHLEIKEEYFRLRTAVGGFWYS